MDYMGHGAGFIWIIWGMGPDLYGELRAIASGPPVRPPTSHAEPKHHVTNNLLTISIMNF